MSPLQDAKLVLMGWTGLAKDALHVYVGLTVLLLAAALLNRPIRDWRPLAIVALVALAGEIWDLVETMLLGRSPRWRGNWKDIWNTLFWPTALFLLARFTRLLKR
jgi:cell shape-determining protein MreD